MRAPAPRPVRRRTSCLVASSLIVALLCGCQGKTPPAADAPPASAQPTGASSDSPDALMKAVFPDWSPTAEVTLAVPAASGGQVDNFFVAPLLVLAPDDQHRLLIVAGTAELDGHVASGYLGMYVFELRQGRWINTHSVPSFGRSGSWGKVGEVLALDLGPRGSTLTVKDTFCGQGQCETVLKVFHLSTQAARLILEEPLSRGTGDETPDPCVELVEAAAAGASTPARYAGLEFAYCRATTGTVKPIRQADRAWADVEIHFTGQDFDVDAASGAVRRTVIDETLLLRYDGKTYMRVSGKNPLAPIP